jgi:hypothetical protein
MSTETAAEYPGLTVEEVDAWTAANAEHLARWQARKKVPQGG